MWKELIGMFATLLILISMSCDSRIYRFAVIMRITNIIGSVLFVIYGLVLPARSTAILNAILVAVNTYHLVLLLKSNRRQK